MHLTNYSQIIVGSMAKSCRKKSAAPKGTARNAKQHKPASRHGITGAPTAKARAEATTAAVSSSFYHKGHKCALHKADLAKLVDKTRHQSQAQFVICK